MEGDHHRNHLSLALEFVERMESSNENIKVINNLNELKLKINSNAKIFHNKRRSHLVLQGLAVGLPTSILTGVESIHQYPKRKYE